MLRVPAFGDEVQTRIGALELNAQGLPSQASVEKLFDEFDFQRATQSYLWGLPIVAFAVWQKVHENTFGAKDGDIVVYSDFKARQGILTANATTPYILSFFDTSRTGPMVVDFPAGELAGGVADFWQRNLSDMGETGPDKGKGGKYLILGPDQKAPADAKGYYVVHSPTFNVFFGFRILTTDEAKAGTIMSALKLYPYAKHAAPPATHIITPHDQAWSGTQPEGMAYWQALNEILQKEPVQERDRYFMAMLRPLGIDKGKAFAPDGGRPAAHGWPLHRPEDRDRQLLRKALRRSLDRPGIHWVTSSTSIRARRRNTIPSSMSGRRGSTRQ